MFESGLQNRKFKKNNQMSVVRKSKLNIPIRKQRSTGIESGRIPEPFQEALNQEDDENIEIYIASFLYGTASGSFS